jgi:hypothetical protein
MMSEKTYKTRKYSGQMTQRSLYIDINVWDRAKVQAAKLGKSVNELINDFLWNLAYSDEIQKLEYDYQGLKKDFGRLVKETRHIVATLKELGVYDQITSLAFKLGLKEDLSNIGEIIPKLTLEWADQDSLIVFIDLLETSKRKRDIADAITRVISKKYLSREGQGDAVQSPVAAAHSVQGAGSVSEVREQRADEGSRPQVS